MYLSYIYYVFIIYLSYIYYLFIIFLLYIYYIFIIYLLYIYYIFIINEFINNKNNNILKWNIIYMTYYGNLMVK